MEVLTMVYRPLRALGVAFLASGCLWAQTSSSTPAVPAPEHALSQPALSPDGSQIAFVAGSAIWTVPASGGAARLLISSASTESRPLYSPDGKWLAFDSTRTGNGDIYLYELATGRLLRLTYDDGMDALDAWSPDSRWIYFSSSSHNVGGMNDIYRVRAVGGTPMIVTSERYESEYYAAAAPDGSVTFVAGGEMPLSQWWRKGESHIDQTAIWNLNPATMTYRKIVDGGAKQIWPMWTPDGRDLYFMSDRDGPENIWQMATGATPRAVTHFTGGRVLFPTIAANGRAIVFERGFGIWRLDLRTRRAAAVPIHLEGVPPGPGVEHRSLNTVDTMAVSPDGKKIAFVAGGEVFAVGADSGGPGLRLTHTGKLQFDLHWSPDSRRIVYISDRTGHDHIYEYDFVAEKERALTQGDTDESHLEFSPDGKWLAFQRGVRDLLAMDTASGQTHPLAQGYFERPPLGQGGILAWSPDSQYLAYLSSADGLFRNAYVVPAAGGDSHEVSFLPNSNSGSLCWSPDGKYLLLQTGQRTEPTRLARVDLEPHTPIFREDLFQKLFTTEPSGERAGRGGRAATPPPPATHILYPGISERLSLLPMTDARGPRISPDGKWLAYIASEGGAGGNIYLYSLDDVARLNAAGGGRGGRGGAGGAPRQLTSTTTAKRDIQFTADSKEIYFLEAGRISHVAVAGGQPRAVAVTADLDVNFNQQKNEVFEQAWRYLRDNYMNAAMNGANWDDVHARYAPVVEGARTPDDLRLVLSEMIGEMNSSHSGISGGGMRRSSTGHLGLFFDRSQYETGGRLCVTEVVPLSPAALADVRPGDCLAAVNGATLDAASNLDQVLDDTIGHKLTLTLDRGGSPATVSLEPVNAATGKNLIYEAWVEHNRQLVDQLSHGALGYIHMNDMSQASLDKLYLDLDATNFTRKGVVIDVRNNNGGFVNAYALDVLTRRPYLTMIPRGFPAGPARVALGQRALEKPTVLVTNQNTLSDSEDFTEGYRTMGLGKVVGEPTAGWIIFTSSARLIDGSTVRMPTDRILDHNGKDMELHPRPVDVAVADPVTSWRDGQDPQLAAAVKTLLAQIAAAGSAAVAAGQH
ncbi:MAG TPA: S41 family peptidase [Terriglobales bacterium]|nr:S41 family peptidase [Terriglobales bacterium]